MLSRSTQSEWIHLQRTMPHIRDLFTPVEASIAEAFLPAMFGAAAYDPADRDLIAFPIKCAGLALPNPAKTAQEHYTNSTTCVGYLTQCLRASDDDLNQLYTHVLGLMIFTVTTRSDRLQPRCSRRRTEPMTTNGRRTRSVGTLPAVTYSPKAPPLPSMPRSLILTRRPVGRRTATAFFVLLSWRNDGNMRRNVGRREWTLLHSLCPGMV